MSRFFISTVIVEGTQVLSKEEIASSVEREIAGNYMFVIPKRNFLLYPKKEITRQLSEEFPRIEELSVSLQGTDTISVKLSERDSIYIWCGEEPPLSYFEVRDCYYVDNSGYVFAPAPYFSGAIYFKFFGRLETTGVAGVPLGGTVLPETLFRDILILKDSLLKTDISSFAFFRGTDEMTLYLARATGSLPKIYLPKEDEVFQSIKNIMTALSAEPLKNDIVDRFSLLEYLDLRYEGKVYYKFNDVVKTEDNEE